MPQLVQSVASDVEWDHVRESALSSPVLTDVSDNFVDSLSVLDDVDIDLEYDDVFQMAQFVSSRIATKVSRHQEEVAEPVMMEIPEDANEDADDEGEEEAYVPGEEVTLKRVWSKPSKLKMSSCEEEFMGKVILGSTWKTPVRWTYSNLQKLWRTVCKRKRLNKFLKNYEMYLKCASDGVYVPSSLGVDIWGDQWVRKWTDHC